MTEYLKRPSILAGIFGLILAVAAFLPGLIPLIEGTAPTPDKQLEIVIAFIVLWLTHVVIVVLQQVEIAEEVKKLSQEVKDSAATDNQNILNAIGDQRKEFEAASQRFMEVLKVEKEFSQDAWLNENLRTIAKLKREANKSEFIRKSFEEEVTKFLDDINKDLRITNYKRQFPKERETYRMERLKRAIETAQQYVIAVTLDGGSYIEEFWSGEFSDEYVVANIDTKTKSRARVQRAFILERGVVSDAASFKHQLVKKVISDHLKNEIEVHVIFKDKLPPSWNGHDTSFLISDDFVVSESYTLSDEGKVPGYVAVKDAMAIHKLKRLFKDLITLSPNELDQLLRPAESTPIQTKP